MRGRAIFMRQLELSAEIFVSNEDKVLYLQYQIRRAAQLYNHCKKIMRQQNSYVIYDEKNNYNGQSYIEYMAFAYSENQVREMAEEQGIDLTGYTIEIDKTNIHDEMGRQYPCKIFSAVVE